MSKKPIFLKILPALFAVWFNVVTR